MSRILLLIGHSENRRLLAEWLRARYDVTAPEVGGADQGTALAAPFDLCIVDAGCLHRFDGWARAVRSASQPEFLPFLLLARRHDIGLATGQIWRTVDELISAPVEKVELHARVEMLLRARNLSVDNLRLLRQVEAELARARSVQEQLLPERPIEVAGFDLAARCLPSHEVGGDFYDWQDLGRGAVILTLGDVMGKGMAAALLMATMRATLRAVTRATPQPGPALDVVRLALAPDLERTGSFVTLFHARLDAPERRLAYVDAGHGHGLVLRADGAASPIERCARPIGVPAPGRACPERTIAFEAGDALVVYSDGLVAPGAPPPTPDELARRLDGAPSAAAMVDRLVGDRSGPTPPADDLTVLVLRCTRALGP